MQPPKREKIDKKIQQQAKRKALRFKQKNDMLKNLPKRLAPQLPGQKDDKITKREPVGKRLPLLNNVKPLVENEQNNIGIIEDDMFVEMDLENDYHSEMKEWDQKIDEYNSSDRNQERIDMVKENDTPKSPDLDF